MNVRSMKEKRRVVLVNYINAKPFAEGLSSAVGAEHFSVSLQNPAQCALDFADGKADIALVPVGALSDLKDFNIITDFCIGCDGEVRTVALFSHLPISDCRRLLLDNHSRTSFLLSRVILEQLMHIQLPWQQIDVQTFQHREDDLILMIGDKVFEQETKFTYHLDLGATWKEWTGLPFVFAVWIARKHILAEEIQLLNSILAQGMDKLDDIIRNENHGNVVLSEYYKRNISYHMDERKRQALALFQDRAGKLL
jgi:chorismate dehydratase